MELEVRVVPNAKKFSVSLKDGMTKIHVPAKAEDGKANAELVQGLQEALGRKVALLRGAKSRAKTLWIEGEEEEVRALLRRIAGDVER